MVNKNRNRGKRAERAIAKALGGSRRGVLGGEDITHPLFSIEVKSRQTFVADKWFQQAVRNCPKGKTPLLVVHVQGANHKKDFVIMQVEDWLKSFQNSRQVHQRRNDVEREERLES